MPGLLTLVGTSRGYHGGPLTANNVVRNLDETDELAFLRIRSKKHEIMVAPDKEYILIVIQNPNLE